MRSLSTLALIYYAFGAFVLHGDFNILGRISSMYAHCKATEDKDLQWFDFITDHLVCFDALVDDHPPSDEQRPHRPLPTKVCSTTNPMFVNEPLRGSPQMVAPVKERNFPQEVDLYHHIALDTVFRPPNA